MRVSMHRRLLPLIMAIVLVASFVPVLPAIAVTPVPKTIYVDAVNGDDATGDGTAEAPYMSITAALGDADYGDTVDIAPGTYSPSETGEVFPLPIMASALTLQGSDPYECIIDAEWDDNIIWMADGSDLTISGLTLTHGVGGTGGAVTVGVGSTLTMSDCILMDNFAGQGGAIYASNATVELTDCELTNNGASADVIVPDRVTPQFVFDCTEGGAIYAAYSTVTISGGLIAGNSAANDGGAIFLGGSTATVDGAALFMNDVAGGMTLESETPLLDDGLLPAAVGLPGFGGAVYAEVTNLDVTDCGFWANTAFIGSSVIGMDSNIAVDGSWFEGDYSMAAVVGNIAGFMGRTSASMPEAISPADMVVEPYLSVENSTFQGSEGAVIAAQECDAFVSNVLAYDNTTSVQDGSSTFIFLVSDADVVNCTLANNMNLGASIYARPVLELNAAELLPEMPEVRVTNSIVWDANEGETSVEGATVTYSDLMYTEDMVPAAFDESVISEDPMFVDAGESDYSLAVGSPCIDTGLDFELAPETDIDGVARPIDGDTSGEAEWDMGAFEFHTDVTDGRIEGEDRYGTAVEISQDHFDSSETAILATGRIFADGLSASGLAGAYNAPVLLTHPNTLPSGVAQELMRLGVNHVIICGDERAISAGVEDAVAALGDIEVERIGGADRYETATLIADEIGRVTDSDPALVFVARGDTYPDALAVSPIAWSMAAPVLLVRPTELPRYTIDYFLEAGSTGTRTIIVGGEAAVSSGVESCMMALGVAPEDRIAGADRYETAVEVAYWAEDFGFGDFSVVGVATGENFADALAGGPGIGASGGVLLLNPKSTVDPAVCDAISDHAGDISVLQIFGSGAAITDAVADQLDHCRNTVD